MQRTRVLAVADVAVKVALVVLLLVAVLYPDLGNVKGKASGARLVGYPLGTLVVPAIWWWRWRPQGRPFPWLGDLLVSLPWFLDTLGNRLDLFDTVAWWDDWMHFSNWALLTAGVLLLGTTASDPVGRVVERAVAFGVSAALAWELVEYVAFIRDSPELETAYTDTLGDLLLGSLGSLLAAAVVVGVRRQGRTSTQTRRWSEEGNGKTPVSRDSGSVDGGQNTPEPRTGSPREGRT